MKVELHGIELRGHHGLLEEERQAGQRFVYDVELEVGERGASDRLEEAVDYSAVARTVQEVSDASTYALLEALAGAVADELLRRFGAERAVVRVAKPDVRPGGLEGMPAVTVSRP